MKLRKWKPADTPLIEAIHKGMDTGYLMPHVDSRLFELKRVAETDDGKIVGGGAVKPIGECFLWVARDEPPILRARAFCRLAAEARVLAAEAGYDELSCWMPPNFETEFGNPLSRAGWTLSPWRNWSVKL